MDFNELALKTIDMGASDLHITVGIPPTIRINGDLEPIVSEKLMPDDTKDLVYQILDERHKVTIEEKGEVDFSHTLTGKGRFRVNAYKQRNSYGMALRVINSDVPSTDELGLPVSVKELARKRRGLVLVTGPTGSGKSTTLAAMINQINEERACHIMTLEDPIEYLHRHKNSIVNQREIGQDSLSFANGLRASLRQDPDVILVGEMRDLETISIAITAAETGHLVFSTLHTLGSAKTIDRVIDVFPPHQQHQIRTQLSSVMEGVISQQLLPKTHRDGRVAAFEVMTGTPAIKSLIREGKTHQMESSIQTGGKYGMQTMDSSLMNLYNKGVITRETLTTSAFDRDTVSRLLNNRGY